VTALLVLLALLSVAMLASRQGAFDELVARAATPILVVTGLAISPAGLGFLDAETVKGLDPAIGVGITWLALLAGLRSSAALPRALITPEGRRASALAVLASVVVSIVAAGVLQAAAGFGYAPVDAAHTAPAALLVGASLAGMPGDRSASPTRAAYAAVAELVVLVAALIAFAAWSTPTNAAVVAGLGVVGAVVVNLVLTSVPAEVAYLAVCVLVAGLCTLAKVPGAVAGFVLGAASAHVRRSQPIVDSLLVTERPARIVVTVVLAAVTPPALHDAIAGAALGVGLVLVQYFVSLALRDGSSLLARLASTVATSTTPLVAVAAFAGAGVDGARALLPAVIVAVAVADAVAFTMSLAARSTARSSSSPDARTVDGATTSAAALASSSTSTKGSP
jgi:hypothetical protein